MIWVMSSLLLLVLGTEVTPLTGFIHEAGMAHISGHSQFPETHLVYSTEHWSLSNLLKSKKDSALGIFSFAFLFDSGP